MWSNVQMWRITSWWAEGPRSLGEHVEGEWPSRQEERDLLQVIKVNWREMTQSPGLHRPKVRKFVRSSNLVGNGRFEDRETESSEFQSWRRVLSLGLGVVVEARELWYGTTCFSGGNEILVGKDHLYAVPLPLEAHQKGSCGVAGPACGGIGRRDVLDWAPEASVAGVLLKSKEASQLQHVPEPLPHPSRALLIIHEAERSVCAPLPRERVSAVLQRLWVVWRSLCSIFSEAEGLVELVGDHQI
mmetsp:Transcript_96040/g.200628  ORF Transcript_96040/g.200628 Transcript_96040/m.200628 type:complete len:244 (+) Transcript_96040:256-987(+)